MFRDVEQIVTVRAADLRMSKFVVKDHETGVWSEPVTHLLQGQVIIATLGESTLGELRTLLDDLRLVTKSNSPYVHVNASENVRVVASRVNYKDSDKDYLRMQVYVGGVIQAVLPGLASLEIMLNLMEDTRDGS